MEILPDVPGISVSAGKFGGVVPAMRSARKVFSSRPPQFSPSEDAWHGRGGPAQFLKNWL